MPAKQQLNLPVAAWTADPVKDMSAISHVHTIQYQLEAKVMSWNNGM